MGTLFEDVWADAAGVLEDHFGEAFTLTPMASSSQDVRLAPARDPDREVITFVGIFSDPAAVKYAEGRNLGQKTTRAIDGQEPAIDVVWPLPVDVHENDIVTRTATGASYRVAAILPDQAGRAKLKLG